MTHEQLVSKVWNYAHVLRDQGISYGDYIEQITYLLNLKMDQEREALLGEPSAIPREWDWTALVAKDGDELDVQYRHTLENLAREDGLIVTIFRKLQNKLSDPAKLKRIVSLIDTEGRGNASRINPCGVEIIFTFESGGSSRARSIRRRQCGPRSSVRSSTPRGCSVVPRFATAA